MEHATGDGREEADAPRHYVNHLSVAASLSEVSLTFGQTDGANPTPRSTLVTSPTHLLGFGRVIAAAIDEYEARYVPIPRSRPGNG